MSSGPELGSGGFFGGGTGSTGGMGGGMGGFPGMGGGFPGMGNMGPMVRMGPRGPYGAWPGCGCSSLFIILAGVLLVFGGCLRMIGQ
jgi:hypothetical protein